MKRIIAAGGAILAVITLAGCTHVNSGTVVKKDYEPSYTYFVTVSTGKSFIVVPEVMPAQWRVDLSNGKHTQWHDVDPAEYAKVKVGQRFQVGP